MVLSITRRRILKAALAAPFIIRPRESRAFGMFPSGGPCTALAQPPGAAAGEYSCVVFSDEFTSLSTIDLTNSQTAGFKWYIAANWPQGGTPWNSGPTKASDLSIASSILTINNTQGASFFSEISLNTAYATNLPTGDQFGGNVFNPGFYVEARMKYDPTLAARSTYNTDPIFWLLPMPALTHTQNNFIENDVMEAFPQGTGVVNPLTALHDLTISSGANNQNTNYQWDSTGYDLTQFHTYGRLWVPAARNGGTGIFQTYIDDVHIPAQDVSYTATGPASPGASPSNPNGTFSGSDSQQFCLMIGCGPNWPAHVDFVRVWQ